MLEAHSGLTRGSSAPGPISECGNYLHLGKPHDSSDLRGLSLRSSGKFFLQLDLSYLNSDFSMELIMWVINASDTFNFQIPGNPFNVRADNHVAIFSPTFMGSWEWIVFAEIGTCWDVIRDEYSGHAYCPTRYSMLGHTGFQHLFSLRRVVPSSGSESPIVSIRTLIVHPEKSFGALKSSAIIPTSLFFLR